MENETEEAIKMKKLKKTNSSPFGNRTCLLHWCLIAWLMKTKLRNEMKWDFPRQRNVNGNSWCNNVLLARWLKRNHQNRKKTQDGSRIVFQVAHKIHQITYGILVSIISEVMRVVKCSFSLQYQYTLNVWSQGKNLVLFSRESNKETKLISFPRNHTLSALIYISTFP